MSLDSDIMMDTMTHINDLPNELLNHIFSFLTDKQLFVIESVCKKWKNLANKAMERIIEFYPKDFCNAFDGQIYYNSYFLVTSYEINDNNIETLKVILTKCPKIKHFYLFETLIKGNNSLI